jgi:hypothetical protein
MLVEDCQVSTENIVTEVVEYIYIMPRRDIAGVKYEKIT